MADLTFRLPGPWGPGKGANLQPAEVDNNFWELAQAIVDLESNPAQPVGIASISVSGTQMTITLTDSTVMGPFTLPVLTFRWRGEWVPGAAYAELDVFTVFDTGIFMALLDHTSGATFDPDIVVGGEPALQQLFGSTSALLSTLGDVEITEPLTHNSAVLWHDGDLKWVNVELGDMALQTSSNVNITGGQIHGMPSPSFPDDVATKAYVDALPAGMSIDDAMMMANISGMVGPALPQTLSDFLDYALLTTVRGTMLYRGGAGWEALEPGAEGLFLQTHDAGLDPTWAPGGSGVVSIDAGPGIDVGGTTIVDTGTISLAEIADDTFLANIAGVSAPPSATTLTLFLDSVLGSARGTILTRGVGGWAALAPGTSGQYLKTQGTGADAAWDSPIGAGTVTSVAAGAGITTGGSPITSTGSVSLATIAGGTLLANTSGSTAAPIATTPTLLLDQAFGTTQGAVLYRSASAWVILSPGTSGQFLATGGTAANPSWQPAPTTGAAVPTGRIISNISGSNATPSGNTLTNILDAIVSSARGTLIYRGNSAWAGLAPGTAGQILQTGGASGDPSWTAAPGAVPISNSRIMSNISGASAAPIGNTLTGIFDSILGASRGMIIYRDNSNWRVLAAGTAGQFLRTGGTSGDPSWATSSAGITQLTGEVTAGPGSGSQAAALSNTTVAPGSYTSANITVDAKGRLTAASNGTGGGGGIAEAPSDGIYYGRLNAAWAAVAPLASPALTGTPTAPTATAGTSTVQLATTAFVGTAVAAIATGITQLTGDATAGPGSGSQALTLASTAVTPGSYTAADITVDAKGRITAASNGTGGGGGGTSAQIDTFTSSGTWTKPAGAKSVTVILYGGGGGGGAGLGNSAGTARAGGTGGGGGACVTRTFLASHLSGTEAVTVPAAAAGGATSGAVGTVGGDTSFGTRLVAYGGGRGNGGGVAAITGGGGGGSASAGVQGGSSAVSGGLPTNSGTVIATGGGGGGSAGTGGWSAEWGGGGGGAVAASTFAASAAGASLYGAGGGGAGGGVSSGNAAAVSGAGGGVQTMTGNVAAGGGGAAGATGSGASGTGGTGGDSTKGGTGGGGGGSNAGGAGGTGGAGGSHGGGGGGGGGGLTFGAGGAGGAGAAYVITYF